MKLYLENVESVVITRIKIIEIWIVNIKASIDLSFMQ